MSAVTGLLPCVCVCGHDHETIRGEHVYACLECSCDDFTLQCQNCGEPHNYHLRSTYSDGRVYEVCSQRCKSQIEYALSLRERAA